MTWIFYAGLKPWHYQDQHFQNLIWTGLETWSTNKVMVKSSNWLVVVWKNKLFCKTQNNHAKPLWKEAKSLKSNLVQELFLYFNKKEVQLNLYN